MEISDLTVVGRLGGPDREGFFQLLVKPRFRDVLAATEDVFLIFNSDRVFYVTISDRELQDRKLRVKFAEDGIAEERAKHKEAILAIELPPDEPDQPDALLGYTVVFGEREIGEVRDYFFNNAQYVLVIATPNDRELLVPLVDYYLAGIIPDPGVVMLRNAKSLLGEEEDPC